MIIVADDDTYVCYNYVLNIRVLTDFDDVIIVLSVPFLH
jgi:hypothetical protein